MNKKFVKIVAVGDRNCDRTRLLFSCTKQQVSDEYIPFFDNYSNTLTIENMEVEIQLSDTEGYDDYKKMRPGVYFGTNVFILVFSLVSPTSLENIENIWVPEIKESVPQASFILVGTKKYYRDTFELHEKEYHSNGWEPVTTDAGFRMMDKIHASKYVECDATEMICNKIILIEAINLALNIKIEQNKVTDILKIGLCGSSKGEKNEIALKYILGEFHHGSIPLNENDFLKIVEINNKLHKLTIDVNNPRELSEINGMIFLFNIKNQESYEELKVIFQKNYNKINIPYIVVANYTELNDENRNNLITIEQYNDLKKVFKKQSLFLINSTLDEDIEDIFFCLLNEIIKKNKKQKIHKMKKKKCKDKIQKKILKI